MHFSKAPPIDGEILSETVDWSAINCTMARDYAITRNYILFHAKVTATVFNKGINFLKRTFIEQSLQSFSRSQLTFGMLSINSLSPSSSLSNSLSTSQIAQPFLGGFHSAQLAGDNTRQ
jgi:hypothetical protein